MKLGKHLQRELDVAGLAAKLIYLAALLTKQLDEEPVLSLDGEREPAQLFDVLFAL